MFSNLLRDSKVISSCQIPLGNQKNFKLRVGFFLRFLATVGYFAPGSARARAFFSTRLRPLISVYHLGFT